MKSKNFVATSEGEELAVLCIDLGYKLAGRVQDLTRLQVLFLLQALARRREIASLVSALKPEEGATTFIFTE